MKKLAAVVAVVAIVLGVTGTAAAGHVPDHKSYQNSGHVPDH